MTNKALSAAVDRTLGVVGLFLMLVVAKLADRAQSPQRTVAGRVAGFLARRGIDGVAMIGWVVDQLPLRAAPPVRPRAASPSSAAERLHWV